MFRKIFRAAAAKENARWIPGGGGGIIEEGKMKGALQVAGRRGVFDGIFATKKL